MDLTQLKVVRRRQFRGGCGKESCGWYLSELERGAGCGEQGPGPESVLVLVLASAEFVSKEQKKSDGELAPMLR